jgi:hypothetical protein
VDCPGAPLLQGLVRVFVHHVREGLEVLGGRFCGAALQGRNQPVEELGRIALHEKVFDVERGAPTCVVVVVRLRPCGRATCDRTLPTALPTALALALATAPQLLGVRVRHGGTGEKILVLVVQVVDGAPLAAVRVAASPGRAHRRRRAPRPASPSAAADSAQAAVVAEHGRDLHEQARGGDGDADRESQPREEPALPVLRRAPSDARWARGARPWAQWARLIARRRGSGGAGFARAPGRRRTGAWR